MPANLTEQDPRWLQVVARDARADGAFVYAVISTGIYCRPSCPSRRAKPQNVRFFNTGPAAEAAGFRPCLRCSPQGHSPQQANVALIAEACRLIEAADEPPKLDSLAARIGLSPGYFHRQFRAITGVTPKQWAQAQRSSRMRLALADPDQSVTAAICEAGFNAGSRFYEGADARLGMTPTAWRRGGKDVEIRFAIGATSLGALLVAQTARGLCALTLGEDPEALVRALQDRFPHARMIGNDQAFEALVAQVVGFVEAPQLGLDLPLDLQGTAFQERVWQALRQIPPGQTLSYSALAQRIGMPKSARAVAQACAANPIAVAIPCHRVVRKSGDLSGYRWGVARKAALLAKERPA